MGHRLAGGTFILEAVQDIAFLSATPSRGFLNIYIYNVLYHKGILKMEQKLGGVAIPESKPFTS